MIEACAADENYIYYLYFRIALIIYHIWILLSLEKDFPGRSQIGPPPILPLSSSPFPSSSTLMEKLHTFSFLWIEDVGGRKNLMPGIDIEKKKKLLV